MKETQASARTASPIRRRNYVRPSLVKGPVLAKVTAEVISGGGGCWVARAAFGEADFRWMIFRAWLLEDSPVWFRAAYRRHGPSIGAWLAGRDRLRAQVQTTMMWAIRRKLGI